MMKILNQIREIFDFNSTERNGSLVLIVLSLIILLFPCLFKGEEAIDLSIGGSFALAISEFEKGLSEDTLISARISSGEPKLPSDIEPPAPACLFGFNPNGLSTDDWKKLGLAAWQIKVIKNYESKGGRFFKKEDLSKIYGISESLYQKLEPYIEIPQQPQRTVNVVNKEVPASFVVDINKADTNELMEIRGIGPAYARRIVKYREKLGGFYSVEQLLEVYGFDQQRLDQVKKYCVTGSGPYRLIPINTTGTKELKMHPYFDYASAKALVDGRIQKGGFKGADDVRKVPGMEAEFCNKIIPYLSFD